MTFRTRLFVAFATTAVVPLVVLGVGIGHEVDRQLTAAYQRRVTGLAARTRGDLASAGSTVAARLASVRDGVVDDDRFRLAAVQDAPSERRYLLDYAVHAMRLSGLAMLQIDNDSGRILSSGHYRNEFDRMEPDLVPLLVSAPGGTALVSARTPDGAMLILAGVDSLRLGGRRFALVGGIEASPRLLGHLVADSELSVALIVPSGMAGAPATIATGPSPVSPRTAIVASFPFPVITAAAGGGRAVASARFEVTQSLTGLHALRAAIVWWCFASVGLAAAAALLTANWLADRISRPLRSLAEQSTRVNLEAPAGDFPNDRDDEIGALSRVLAAMVRRLRTNATGLRDAERRATVGDLARQVTHDVKNGLVPIRHVVRHLTEVQHTQPDRLATVFAQRRPTLDASIAYLDELARTYARLSPPLDVGPCDVNAVAHAVAAGYTRSDADGSSNIGASIALHLDAAVPAMAVDALVVRRILENLVANACEAAGQRSDAVMITTESLQGGVRVTVADGGCGMTSDELRMAFNDFYTTKPTGTGLGLSIVSRLVRDIHGELRVETAPGTGTRVIVTLAGPSTSTATPLQTRPS
jgi:signal transduction histidine kinase